MIMMIIIIIIVTIIIIITMFFNLCSYVAQLLLVIAWLLTQHVNKKRMN